MKKIELYLHKGKVYIRETNYKGKVFIILMSTPTAIHILTPVIGIKPGDPSRGVKARAIVIACSTSGWITVPIGTITAILAEIATFNTTTGAAKLTAWSNINTGLKLLRNLFADEMGTDPEHAREICESGGFSVKSVVPRQRNVFGVVQGASGEVIATGNTSRKTCCHDWMISVDGINFVRMEPTCDAGNIFSGLMPLKRYWFRHTLIMAKGPNGPTQTIYLDVI